MAKRQKTATPQEPVRQDLFANRPEQMKGFYDIVNRGFLGTESTGDDREKSQAVDQAEQDRSYVKPDEVDKEEAESKETAEEEAAKGEEGTDEVETTEEGEEAEAAEEVEAEEGAETADEEEYTEAVELGDGTRIPVEDLEMMSKVFRDKEGKALPISEVVEIFNAGLDPTIFLRKGNEVRTGLTKDLTAKDAKIASLEQQIDALTQEAVEAKRTRVAKPDASLLDSNPAAYNAQLMAWVESKGETETRVAELTARRQQAQAKIEADVQQSWDTWHKELDNADFLKNLSAQDKEQFEAGVIEVLQDSYKRTGILMPMAVPMQYTIAKLQWEKKVKADNLASASLGGAQAEQRKRMRLVKAAKSQISHGAITTSRAKLKVQSSSPEFREKLQKAISSGDQDKVKKILKEAQFGE